MLLFLLSLVSGNIVTYREIIEGTGLQVLHQSLIYKKSDIYGSQDPYISLNCNAYIGIPVEISAYLAIVTESDIELINSTEICTTGNSSRFAFTSISSSSLTINITHTDAYYTTLIKCTDAKFTLHLIVTSLNPYGHIPGDLFYLIPVIAIKFYFLSTSCYIFLLFAWFIKLICNYSHSITIQRIWIPVILIFCLIENSLDFSHWFFYNHSGHKSILSLVLAVLIKSFKDSLARVLLLAASKGWGVVPEFSEDKNWTIFITGCIYFIFDMAYLIVLRTIDKIPLFLLSIVSIPLIILNLITFYFIFSWLKNIFTRLHSGKQRYKLSLMKQFALVLGIAGLISVGVVVIEGLSRYLWRHGEEMWASWAYVAIWEIVFMVVVGSLMVIWRVSDKSKLLSVSEEVSHNEISKEDEEEKFGIELSFPRFDKKS